MQQINIESRIAAAMVAALLVGVCNVPAFGAGGPSFINWESPHVSPLAMTPDGTKLLAVNTADNRLEVLAVSARGLDHGGHIASIPVGLDPVSVRARTNNEAWVVNHISDSISIVNLDTMNVVRTLNVGDEPSDVVFAGNPQRAFVSLALPSQIKVYDPANLSESPQTITIQGHRPKALATDGTNVYVAIFEAGNNTTIIDENVVSTNVNPYPGNPNPAPNNGTSATSFFPPIAPGLPTPPHTSLILKKQPDGTWRDGNFAVDGGAGANWSAAVTWDLHGHDVAVIDAHSLAVSYVKGLMNLNTHVAVSPSGAVTVIGTDAMNHIRFEPNLRGTFLRVNAGVFPAGGGAPIVTDLNPHLDYLTSSIPMAQREQSVGDPRGIAFNAAGDRAYITGMGSNNLLIVDSNMNRVGLTSVGEGPTGVVVDDANGRVYVLNKFEGSISVINVDSLSEMQRIYYYDPTPNAIRDGRPFLYNTHLTSGLGHTSCASCHVDGRLDQIAWDLGDPQGQMKTFNQECNLGIPFFGQCEDWHPMKGPMTTQTLVGIIGTEPLHWRGDREDLAAFNGAFPGLLGADSELTSQEMADFEAFIATLRFSPNPNRNIDNSLKTSVFVSNGVGNAVTGANLFNTVPFDGGVATCALCHALPTGTIGSLTSGNLLQEAQSMKIPQLRNMHEKTGFFKTSQNNDRGFGFIHDGSIATLFEFLQFSGFNFAGGATGNQQRRDIEAFMLSFSTDTHGGVGMQTTVDTPNPPQSQMNLLEQMIGLAESGAVGMVVKGIVNREERGFAYIGGNVFQSDRAVETYTNMQLLALAGPGSELTATLVPKGSEIRIGIDRDEDGYYDRDELDAGSDPADPFSTPENPCPHIVGDLTGNCAVGVPDLLMLLSQWGPCADCQDCPADLTGSCTVGVADLLVLLANWG